VALVVAAVLALAASVWWLVYTIQFKWLYGLTHPLVTVSVESVQSLPVFFGAAVLPGNMELVYLRTIPWMWNDVSGLRETRYVSCTGLDGVKQYDILWCLPTDESGALWLTADRAGAPADERSGASARSALMNDWPLQFHSNQDILCVDTHLMVNDTRMQQNPNPGTPGFALYMFNISQALGLAEVLHYVSTLGNSSADSAAAADALNAWSAPIPYMAYTDWDSIFYFHSATTRTLYSDGRDELDYAYSSAGHMSVQPATVDSMFRELLTETPNATERVQLTALHNRSDVTYHFHRFCTQPQSMMVNVVRQSHPYTLASFLADVGGALNLLTVVLLALFPLAKQVTQPRTFGPLLWMQQCRRRSQAQKAGDDDESTLQRPLECAMTEHAEAREGGDLRQQLLHPSKAVEAV